jgi:hypothetical protein
MRLGIGIANRLLQGDILLSVAFSRLNMDTALSICVGIGLSAACGFRVFVPFLILSIASLSGHATLASHFQWIGTYPALIAFSVATALEIGGYYIPWIDHLLDTLATPAAVVAGIIVTGSMLTKVDPFLQWSLAVIAGGGIAGAVQAGTVLTRAASTATTGGLGNPLVATAELGLSLFASILALVAPILAALLVLVLGIFFGRKLWKRFRPSQPAGSPV